MSDKTQCPSCGTIYPMPKDKLSDPNVRANCGRCKKSFLLNKHLITQPSSSPSQAPKPSTQPTQAQKEVVIGANELINDEFSLPKVPIRQKKSSLPAEGMIYDDMDSDDNDVVDFGDDLDDFLHSDTLLQDNHQSSKDTNQIASKKEDAWLDDLLKEKDLADSSLVAHNPNDDLSQVLGVDLTSVIPEAKKEPNRQQSVIVPKTPTQQQLARQRPLGHYLGWGLACLGLVGLLLVQYVFFNANAIAKHSKNAALINALCLDCLPSANPKALMTNYTLSDGAADYSTNLLGSISNISNQDQLYPNLKITLLGDTGIIGELALAPKDYLPFAGQHRLAAKQSGRFLLTLDMPRGKIDNVVIEPFY